MMSDNKEMHTYQSVLDDSASREEVEAFEESFGQIHPVFRVPYRPKRNPIKTRDYEEGDR